MNVKKLVPIVLLVIMAVAAIMLRRCNSTSPSVSTRQTETRNNNYRNTPAPDGNSEKLDRNSTDLFFTKHAKCRMDCRHINETEIKEILANGNINYKKSNLDDPKGPTYAVEGMTREGQHLRIIFAPKKQHLTVVTVIDLEVEFECNCT